MRHSRRLEAIAQMADSSTHADWSCLNIEFTWSLWSVFFLIVLCSCSCNMLKDSHTNDLSCATQSGLGIFVVLKESWKPSIGFTWFHRPAALVMKKRMKKKVEKKKYQKDCGFLIFAYTWIHHVHSWVVVLFHDLFMRIVRFNENTCDQ